MARKKLGYSEDGRLNAGPAFSFFGAGGGGWPMGVEVDGVGPEDKAL